MGEGLIVRRGGGANLNFKVVDGTSTPSSPSENTIWVNTDTAVTDWIFSAIQPTSKSDGTPLSGGEVWLETRNTSPVAMNALKKNALWVYPTACKQYVSGAWVAKTAKTYQNGAWVDWFTYLYSRGNEYTDLTGGWVCQEKRGSKYSDTLATLTNTTAGLKVVCAAQRSGIIRCSNKINLTDVKTITFTVSGTFEGVFLYVLSDLTLTDYSPVNIAASLSVGDSNAGTYSLSIDLTGLYYVGIGISTSYGKATTTTYIEEVRME